MNLHNPSPGLIKQIFNSSKALSLKITSSSPGVITALAIIGPTLRSLDKTNTSRAFLMRNVSITLRPMLKYSSTITPLGSFGYIPRFSATLIGRITSGSSVS